LLFQPFDEKFLKFLLRVNAFMNQQRIHLRTRQPESLHPVRHASSNDTLMILLGVEGTNPDAHQITARHPAAQTLPPRPRR
jgi:hypothetical protein